MTKPHREISPLPSPIAFLRQRSQPFCAATPFPKFPFVLLSPSTTSCFIRPHSRSPISPSQPAVLASCFISSSSRLHRAGVGIQQARRIRRVFAFGAVFFFFSLKEKIPGVCVCLRRKACQPILPLHQLHLPPA